MALCIDLRRQLFLDFQKRSQVSNNLLLYLLKSPKQFHINNWRGNNFCPQKAVIQACYGFYCTPFWKWELLKQHHKLTHSLKEQDQSVLKRSARGLFFWLHKMREQLWSHYPAKNRDKNQVRNVCSLLQIFEQFFSTFYIAKNFVITFADMNLPLFLQLLNLCQYHFGLCSEIFLQ